MCTFKCHFLEFSMCNVYFLWKKDHVPCTWHKWQGFKQQKSVVTTKLESFSRYITVYQGKNNLSMEMMPMFVHKKDYILGNVTTPCRILLNIAESCRILWNLVEFEKSWEILGNLGKSWKILGNLGESWGILEIFQNLSESFAILLNLADLLEHILKNLVRTYYKSLIPLILIEIFSDKVSSIFIFSVSM